MNYLDAVAFVESGFLPVNAAHDSSVEFNRQTLGRKLKLPDKLREVDGRCHVQRFAIDFYTHSYSFPSRSRLMNDTPYLGAMPFGRGADEDSRSPGLEVRQHRVKGRDPCALGLARKD